MGTSIRCERRRLDLRRCESRWIKGVIQVLWPLSTEEVLDEVCTPRQISCIKTVTLGFSSTGLYSAGDNCGEGGNR